MGTEAPDREGPNKGFEMAFAGLVQCAGCNDLLSVEVSKMALSGAQRGFASAMGCDLEFTAANGWRFWLIGLAFWASPEGR